MNDHGWRELARSEELRALEADLEDAERRILGDLAVDPPPPNPAPAIRARRAEMVARVAEIADQSLTIPRGRGSARVVGDQALFGVAMPVDQARALLDAWVELMEDEPDNDSGLPPSPEVVAISEFLFVLLNPLAEKLTELP